MGSPSSPAHTQAAQAGRTLRSCCWKWEQIHIFLTPANTCNWTCKLFLWAALTNIHLSSRAPGNTCTFYHFVSPSNVPAPLALAQHEACVHFLLHKESLQRSKCAFKREYSVAKILLGARTCRELAKRNWTNPTKSKRVPGSLPKQVTRQSETHPCLVFSTNGSDRSLVYLDNGSGRSLWECLWRSLVYSVIVCGVASYTQRMSLALRRIFWQCGPALAVVCSLFSDNGGQLQLLSLLRTVFSNNLGQTL